MNRCLAAAFLVLVAASVSVAQEPNVFSGPQVGEPIPGFAMKPGYGESAGQEINLVEMAGNDPLVVIFIHKRTRPSFGLANAIMKYCKQYGGESLVCGTCMLTADPSATLKWLTQVQKHLPQGIPVGYSMEGIEGPGSFGLNRNVEMTVIIGTKKRVIANFALVQPGAHADGPAILQAVAKVTGSKKKIDINDFLPSNQGAQDARIAIDPRLKKQIRVIAGKGATDETVSAAIKAIEDLIAEKKPLQNQLGTLIGSWVRNGKIDSIGSDAHQATIRKWAKDFSDRNNRARMNRARMNRDKPSRTETDQRLANRFPELSNLLRAVIQKRAAAEDVDRAAKAVDAYLSKHPGAEKEIGRIANTVVNSGKLENYGTLHAQKILQAWAKQYPVDKK